MTESNDKSGPHLNKSKIRPIRRMKVHETRYTRPNTDPDTSHIREYIETQVPWLNIKGLWLRQAGFEIDTPIKIAVKEGCLVITVDE